MVLNQGFKIVIIPATRPRRLHWWLHWWQRLAAWRPLRDGLRLPTHQDEPNPALPPPGTFWRHGETIFCRAEDYAALKQAVRVVP